MGSLCLASGVLLQRGAVPYVNLERGMPFVPWHEFVHRCTNWRGMLVEHHRHELRAVPRGQLTVLVDRLLQTPVLATRWQRLFESMPQQLHFGAQRGALLVECLRHKL